MTPEELLVEVDDVIRTMPDRANIMHERPENFEWFGRVSAVVHAWDGRAAAQVDAALTRIQMAIIAAEKAANLRNILTALNRMRASLTMQVRGPLTRVIDKGKVFDYFDEVRKIIELAKSDIFFVDPYLDADFVSRYLPHVAAHVPVRLLTQHRLKTLTPAVQAFAGQNEMKVEVRSANFHDRYVIIDQSACYQSGASFKDGGRSSPTTLTQITDAFGSVSATYEGLWKGGKVEIAIV